MTMKVSKALVIKIAIGIAIAFIIAIIFGYPNVLQKEKVEKASKEAEKAKEMAVEVKISAEARPGEVLITSAFIDNDLVVEVLPAIAKQAGISIIPDESVSGLVTCELKDVPLDRALEIVLAGTIYTVKKMPNYYLICPGDIKTTKFPLLHQKGDTTNGIEYGQLFINVVDEDRKPINITKVKIWKKRDEGGASAESFVVTSTNNSGLHKIENIPAGRYHAISINEDGYAPFNQFDILVEKDSQNIMTCTLSRGGMIEGLVINEQGKPVEGMPVVVNSILCRRDVITDENGCFTANHLPDTGYSIIAEPKSDSPYKTTVFRGDVFCGQKDIKIILENKGETKLRTSLVNRKLPGFNGIKINLNPDQIQDKMMLLCFFDMNQRPSRNCLLQLKRRVQELKAKDVVVVAVQVLKVDENKLNDWIKKNNIPFSIGMIRGDEDKIRFNWGVRSLPWLIMTDKKHTVTAEGFNITELDDKLNGNSH
jgi:hypothetical protein